MRSVKQVGKTLVLLCGSAAWASCAHIEDIAVGALEQDAGSELEPPSLPATPPDASEPAPAVRDAGSPDAGTSEGRESEDDDRRELEVRDAGSAPDAALAVEAGTLDAGSLTSATDASSDTTDANMGLDAGADASVEERDASTDAARSLLCTLEPWHCL
jgi:hypothetical protein